MRGEALTLSCLSASERADDSSVGTTRPFFIPSKRYLLGDIDPGLILDLLLYYPSDTMATKVVVRRLPAQLGEADFWAKLCEGAGQPVGFSLLYYVAGKISRRRGPIPSRGYLSFGSSEVRRARRRARAAS